MKILSFLQKIFFLFLFLNSVPTITKNNSILYINEDGKISANECMKIQSLKIKKNAKFLNKNTTATSINAISINQLFTAESVFIGNRSAITGVSSKQDIMLQIGQSQLNSKKLRKKEPSQIQNKILFSSPLIMIYGSLLMFHQEIIIIGNTTSSLIIPSQIDESGFLIMDKKNKIYVLSPKKLLNLILQKLDTLKRERNELEDRMQLINRLLKK